MTPNDHHPPSTCAYCGLPTTVRRRIAGPAAPLYCCYGCRFAAEVAQAHGEQGRLTWLLTRLGVSVFLTMGVMVCSFYLYGQEIYTEAGTPPSALEINLTGLMRHLCLLLSVPVLLLLGLPILSNAGRQLRQGSWTMDGLVVVGVAAAFLFSYASTLGGHGATYYETGCMILVLVTFGRWLEASGRHAATENLKSLERLLPNEVPVRRGDAWSSARREDLRPDDVVLVRAGQRCAVDGTIEEGRSFLDRQLVSGESAAGEAGPGDAIEAGVMPVDGALVVRARRVGTSSTLGRFAALLEQARISRGAFERLADRMVTAFVPTVLVLTVWGAVLGWHRGGADEAVLTALAVALIACPCALGIATPLALWAALGRCAERGVLIRRSEALERLARVRTVYFDKTGTLTTGRSRLTAVATAAGWSAEDLLALASGLAEGSSHVLCSAIAERARADGLRPRAVGEVRTAAGRGVSGRCGGTDVCLGSPAFMAEQGATWEPPLSAALQRMQQSALSVVCVGRQRRAVGVLGFEETPGGDARQALDELKRLGCEVLVLTGDHAQRAACLASQLNVAVTAGLSPADKVEQVRGAAARGAVVMVGDGLNDAPALAAADVGLALGCGAELTRESADICLLGGELRIVAWLIDLARRTVRTIRVNLFWAFAYNVVGIGLALSGRLSPVFAALAMVASSVAVVAHSMRLAGRAELAAEEPGSLVMKSPLPGGQPA
jgi:heavy metal translocating P-type ATPase